jgi:alpha-beta hydrolase superfamily lysophospholipase
MEYTNSKRNTPNVDAYIMQAPTSDRETAAQLMSPDFYARTLQHAEDMIMLEDEDEIMPGVLVPSVFTSPLSAYRWHSLIAKGGDDDFFSSDLDEATLVRTFGRLGKPTLLMPSENDEMVPQSVDKEALLRKWTDAAPKGVVSDLSGVNPGADHGLSEEEARAWFSDRVVRFLHTLGEL